MQSLRREDVAMAIEGDGVEFRAQQVGEMSIAWVRLPAGTDLRPALAGLPGDLCQCPHWGYMVSGELRMYTSDGSQTYEAGQAFYWAPGHAPEAVQDCEYIDFSPSAALDDVINHIKAQA